MDDKMQKKISNISNTMADETGDLQMNTQPISIKEPELTKRIEVWDNLYQALTKLGKSKTHKELFTLLPKVLSNLISFDKISLILFNERIISLFDSEGENDGLRIRKMFHNGGWIKVLNTNIFPLSNPQFQSIGEILIGKKRLFSGNC